MKKRPRWGPWLGIPLLVATSCAGQPMRKFPDRPVAWYEHDDASLRHEPRENRWSEARGAHMVQDNLVREVDRTLSLEQRRTAEDVNAMDEVPCSTWFCPRNHLVPMTPEELAAGNPEFSAPVPPITILSGKRAGAAPGWVVEDAEGKKFIMKFDPRGHLGLVTGAERIGPLLFHAMGYNVPTAFIAELDRNQIVLDPEATYKDLAGEKKTYRPEDIDRTLELAERLPDGKIRFVFNSFLPGKILGAFDFQGRRVDDPNDKIPHQHRRSLRATYLAYAWLNYVDAGANNTLDILDEKDGKKFVRHFFVDFGAALGAWTAQPKTPHLGADYNIDVKTWFLTLITLGIESRSFQNRQAEWKEAIEKYPGVGWLQTDGWDPRKWRSHNIVPAHMRMTARDAYWGAKIITSFTDEQIDAVVAEAKLRPHEAAYLAGALRMRRDAIGRAYLLDMTAVENPRVDGGALCFDDLAITRMYATKSQVEYEVQVRAGKKQLFHALAPAAGMGTCVGLGLDRGADGGPYRVVTVKSFVDGEGAYAAHIHLSWRAAERRWAVVGVDRDE